MELLDWTYSALCMLGKADDKDSPEHTEPCFIESKIIPHNFSKEAFSETMSEMKQGLAFYFEKKGVEETVEEVKDVVMEEITEVEEVTEEVVEETAIEEVVAEEMASEEEVVESDPEEEPEVEAENVELNALQSEFDEYIETHKYSNEEYDELKAIYDELKAFKDNYDAAELRAKKDEIFAREEYSGNDYFEKKLLEKENVHSLMINEFVSNMALPRLV
jgi:hypothetical protein